MSAHVLASGIRGLAGGRLAMFAGAGLGSSSSLLAAKPLANASPLLLFSTNTQQRQDNSPAGVEETLDVAIKRDHDGIKETFQNFFNEGTDAEKRQRFAWQIIRDLSIHSLAEEEAVYPAFKHHLGTGQRDHALDEHTKLKEILVDLDGMKLQQTDGSINQEYVHKMRSALQELEHHVAEEEDKWVTTLLDKMSPEEAAEVARSFNSAKLLEPTRPHTLAPDKPSTGNVIGNIATAPLDKLRDIVGRWGMEEIPSAVIRSR